jgi:hypothetical protein
LPWKDDVRVSTQGNINLAAPGATIDGVTMVSQNRFLGRLQTTASENGIYIWNGASTPATRALDASTFAELEQAVVPVKEGTDAGTQWRQTQINGTIGSSALNWVPFGTSAPNASETTAGILEIATQPEVDGGTDDQRAITSLKLKNWSGGARRDGINIGDGTATSFTITHSFNSLDVDTTVILNSTGEKVLAEVRNISVNAVQVIITPAPASNAYRVRVKL